MFSQSEMLAVLAKYQPIDETERDAVAFINKFVAEHPRYWSRATLAGHTTASAWITNADDSKAVLLHHKKLDIWVQPGGHVDDADATIVAASLREASEETGLTGLQLARPGLFDVDVHAIPERKNEPKHWHLDLRFWFRAENETLVLSEESNELRWLSRAEVEALTDEESVLRMMRKTLR